MDSSESIPGYDETDVPSCVIQVVLGSGSPHTWQSRTPPLLFEKVEAGGKGAWKVQNSQQLNDVWNSFKKYLYALNINLIP